MTTAQVRSSLSCQSTIRVLIVTPSFPYPPHGGAELRYYHLIKRLARQYKISLVTLTASPVADRFVGKMRDYCEEVIVVPRHTSPRWRQIPSIVRLLLSGRPFGTKYYNDDRLPRILNRLLTRRPYDILQIEHSEVAGIIRRVAAKHLRNTRTLLTFHNVVYLKDRSILALEGTPYNLMKTMLNLVSMKAWERAMTAEFDACIAMSPPDCEALKSLGSDINPFIVPNGVDTQALKLLPPNKDTRTLLFVGDCNYLPNRDGVSWFYKHVFGAIRDSVPDVRLLIVGKGSDEWLHRLGADPSVSITGHVDDVVAFYEHAAISIVPLRAGGGTRLKILESMALGRPVVSTSIGCEGLNVGDGKNILIANEPERFAECVVKLLHDPILSQRLITNARQLVAAEYDWNTIARMHSELYQRLVSGTQPFNGKN